MTLKMTTVRTRTTTIGIAAAVTILAALGGLYWLTDDGFGWGEAKKEEGTAAAASAPAKNEKPAEKPEPRPEPAEKELVTVVKEAARQLHNIDNRLAGLEGKIDALLSTETRQAAALVPEAEKEEKEETSEEKKPEKRRHHYDYVPVAVEHGWWGRHHTVYEKRRCYKDRDQCIADYRRAGYPVVASR